MLSVWVWLSREIPPAVTSPLTVTVLSMDGRRVERVLVKLAPSEADKD